MKVISEDDMNNPEEANMENTEINFAMRSGEVVKKALGNFLKVGKASGIDNISSEVLRGGAEITVDILHTLFGKIKMTSTILDDWKRGLLVNILKKEDNNKCKN